MQAVVIRVTSATTLMYSHGRGARGAVAGLDIGRRVVTHVAQTGKTKRLPMLIPLIIHILPYRPHPTDPCLCNPASTRSPPPLVIIPLRSVIVLPTSSTSIVHPLVCWAAPRSSNVASSSSNDAPSRSRGRARSSSDAPRSPRGAPSKSRAAPGSLREAPSSSMGMKMIGGMMMLAISSWLKPQEPLVARPLVPRHTQLPR